MNLMLFSENSDILKEEKMLRSKTKPFTNLKVIIYSLFCIFLVLLILWSSFASPKQTTITETQISKSITLPDLVQDQAKGCESSSTPLIPVCTKTPLSLANAIVHYATTNITPQQTINEISVTLKVLERKSPCNFLVFGLGHDSLMWASLNHGGRTVFLEEDKTWIGQIKQKLPNLESYHVEYDTKRHQADQLMEIGKAEECKTVSDPRSSRCQLALKGFPREIYEIEWDLIMVDAPTGYHDEAPGRMNAIYTAGLMARNRENGETDVFIHDVDRAVEDKFSKAFLCEGYLVQQEGRIRHFIIPSHRTRSGRRFCP